MLNEVIKSIFSRIEELKVKVSKTGIQKALADLFKTLKGLKLDSVMYRPIGKYKESMLNHELYIFKDKHSHMNKRIFKIQSNYQRISHY